MLLHFQCLRSGILNLALLLCALLIGSPTTQAADVQAPTGTINLPTALNFALESNPDLAVVARERDAIAGVKTQSGLRPNPYFSTSVQDTRRDTRQTTIQLSQEIEWGDKRQARLDAADANYRQAEAALSNKEAELHADVVAAFYNLLGAQAGLALAQSSLQVANLALDAATKRVKAGKSAPVEATKSGIAQSSAKIALMQAQSQLNTSRKNLSALWGNTNPQFTMAAGDITVMPEIADLATLMTALDTAPALKAARIEVQTREMLTKVEQSKATPNITISAGVINNQELGINQALLGLSVPIPVFDRNQGNLQTAVSRQYQAKDALLALQNQLSIKLETQYARFDSAKATAKALHDDILSGAQSAFEVANKGFTAGKFNFLEVLDAQRTLFQVKTQYIQALLEAHLAAAEIERILGPVINHLASTDARTDPIY